MTRLLAVVAVTAVAAAACDRRPAVTSCRDDLHGVWIAPSGRWAVLDHGAKLEAFALFDDTARSADVLAAPRVIDLARSDTLAGEIKRRYMSRGEECISKAPIRIASCKDDTLQVVVAEPQPAIRFSPCACGEPTGSHVEHWRRD